MRFVARRLGFFLVTLWAAVTLNFLIPRLMPGNAAISMMGRYKGHVNPQALHALEVAFGVNTHQSLVSAYFTYLGNIFTGALRNLAHVLPGHGRAPGAAGAAVDTRARGHHDDPRVRAGNGDRARLRVAARRRAGRSPTAALRHHVRLPVLLARASRHLAVRHQARVAPGERRLRRDDHGRLVVGLHLGRVHSLDPPGAHHPRHGDRRLDPDDAQQHDHRPGGGLRAHGAGEGAQAVADHVDVRRTQRDPAQPGRVRDVARLRGRRRDPRRVRLQLSRRRLDVPPVRWRTRTTRSCRRSS